MKEEAVEVINVMQHNIKQEMDDYLTFDEQKKVEIQALLRKNLSVYYQLIQLYKTHMPKEEKLLCSNLKGIINNLTLYLVDNYTPYSRTTSVNIFQDSESCFPQ